MFYLFPSRRTIAILTSVVVVIVATARRFDPALADQRATVAALVLFCGLVSSVIGWLS